MLSPLTKAIPLCDKVKFSEDFTAGCTVESSEGNLSVSSQECHYTLWKAESFHVDTYLPARLKRLSTFLLKMLTNAEKYFTPEVYYNKKKYTSR